MKANGSNWTNGDINIVMIGASPILPSLIPILTLFWLRIADDNLSINRNKWDQEYDYIIGKINLITITDINQWGIIIDWD